MEQASIVYYFILLLLTRLKQGAPKPECGEAPKPECAGAPKPECDGGPQTRECLGAPEGVNPPLFRVFYHEDNVTKFHGIHGVLGHEQTSEQHETQELSSVIWWSEKVVSI